MFELIRHRTLANVFSLYYPSFCGLPLFSRRFDCLVPQVSFFKDTTCGNGKAYPFVQAQSVCIDQNPGLAAIYCCAPPGTLCIIPYGQCVPPVYPKECLPELSLDKQQCDKRISHCAPKGIQMKFNSQGCSDTGRGTSGCQCDQYCGYACEKACMHDPQCFWDTQASQCVNKLSGLVGEPMPICLVVRGE